MLNELSILFWCTVWSGPDCMKCSLSSTKIRVRIRRFGDFSCLHQRMLDIVTNYRPWGETHMSPKHWIRSQLCHKAGRPRRLLCFLDAFATEFQKAAVSRLCLSVRPFVSSRVQLDGFSWSFMLGVFTKICDLTQFLLKFGRNNTAWKP